MCSRVNISSGAVWEEKVGYSRAVRVGATIEVSGTVASDAAGNVVGAADPEQQTAYILQKIEKALQQAGASLRDVVRTRIYVTNIAHFEAVGRAHHAAFADIRPSTTLVEVKGLVTPDYLVEIEATAILTHEH